MELAFKFALGACLIVLFIVVRGVAVQLRGRSDTGVNQMAHELPVLRVIRPAFGLVFYVALFDWLLPGTRMSWGYYDLPEALRWSGAAVILLSLAGLRASFSALGRNYRGGVGLWSDHELVTTGPYSIVRHPIYTAFILVMIGAWALSANWVVGVSGLALNLSIPTFRLRTEERELESRFGRQYLEYAGSTARFIPWFL